MKTLDANLILYVALFELLVWPHEVKPWLHSWYRGRLIYLGSSVSVAT